MVENIIERSKKYFKRTVAGIVILGGFGIGGYQLYIKSNLESDAYYCGIVHNFSSSPGSCNNIDINRNGKYESGIILEDTTTGRKLFQVIYLKDGEYYPGEFYDLKTRLPLKDNIEI